MDETYQYDALTRRIVTETAAETRHFYFNSQWRAIEERVSGAVKAQYVWNPADRWDLIRRKRSVSGTLDEIRFVLRDYLDPAAIINESGAVTERYRYDAFGPVTVLAPDFSVRATSECGWNFLYHAEFIDALTGLYNYGYRYYHPDLGRWPSRDPIGERGGVNLYGFVGNDGVNRWDILGLWDKEGLLKCLCNCKNKPRDKYLQLLKKAKLQQFDSGIIININTGKEVGITRGSASVMGDGTRVVRFQSDRSNEDLCQTLVEEAVHVKQYEDMQDMSNHSKLAQQEYQLRQEAAAKAEALLHALHNGNKDAILPYIGSKIVEQIPGTGMPGANGIPTLPQYRLKPNLSQQDLILGIRDIIKPLYNIGGDNDVNDPLKTDNKYKNLRDIDTSNWKCPDE